MKKSRADLLARNCGTVWQFFPLSRKASQWVNAHVQTEAWQWAGQSFVIDWRYAEPLIEGAQAAGLEVRL